MATNPTSQNGFSANSRAVIHTVTVPGTDVRVPVRIGPAGDLLVWLAARWHREVEPLRAPDGVLDTWGYAERLIRGSSTTLSNHASGTALDLRARAHPLGRVGTFTPVQVTAIRRILAACEGAIRWGGDYVWRRDEMHVEVVVSEQACRVLLDRLTAPPPPPPPSQPVAPPTLRRGSSGPYVEVLQRYLGVVRAGQPGYGTYGPATEAAVGRYQRMRGLAADGVCGPATWHETGLYR